MAQQVRIEITRIVGHLLPQPGRPRERLRLALQFNFSHHQAGVIAEEVIHFPGQSIAINTSTGLLDQRPLAQIIQQGIRLIQRYLVLPLTACNALRPSLDGQAATLTFYAHAHYPVRMRRQISLTNQGRRSQRAPCIPYHQKLAFYLHAHHAPRRTCASIGCNIARPSCALRAPFQPRSGSGVRALSLNGISSVSDTHLNSWPTYLDASLSMSSRYLPTG